MIRLIKEYNVIYSNDAVLNSYGYGYGYQYYNYIYSSLNHRSVRIFLLADAIMEPRRGSGPPSMDA